MTRSEIGEIDPKFRAILFRQTHSKICKNGPSAQLRIDGVVFANFGMTTFFQVHSFKKPGFRGRDVHYSGSQNVNRGPKLVRLHICIGHLIGPNIKAPY